VSGCRLYQWLKNSFLYIFLTTTISQWLFTSALSAHTFFVTIPPTPLICISSAGLGSLGLVCHTRVAPALRFWCSCLSRVVTLRFQKFRLCPHADFGDGYVFCSHSYCKCTISARWLLIMNFEVFKATHYEDLCTLSNSIPSITLALSLYARLYSISSTSLVCFQVVHAYTFLSITNFPTLYTRVLTTLITTLTFWWLMSST